MQTLLIVGLGNPGIKYKNTYHNVGFMTIDALAASFGVAVKNKECLALTAKLFVSGEKVILAKPQTFMNLSGSSVRELMAKYDVTEEQVMIIYDDIDIPLGSLRIRKDGSGGTHNGMRDIILKAGYTPRMRVGIKRPEQLEPLRSFVLSKISKEDANIMTQTITRAAKAMELYVNEQNLDKVMQEFNG